MGALQVLPETADWLTETAPAADWLIDTVPAADWTVASASNSGRSVWAPIQKANKP